MAIPLIGNAGTGLGGVGWGGVSLIGPAAAAMANEDPRQAISLTDF